MGLSRLTVLAGLMFSWVASGCVSRSVGYEELTESIHARTGAHAQWAYVDDEAEMRTRARKILERPLRAEDAVQVAMLQHPRMQASFEQLALARASMVAAVKPPNPEVEAGLGFSGSDHDPDISLAVTESINGLLTMPMQHDVARAELDAAVMGAVGDAMDFAYDVRVGFYEVQAAQAILELHRDVVRAAKAALDLTEKMHAAGNVTDLVLATERSQYEQARLSLAQAEAMAMADRNRLASMMGLWGEPIEWTVSMEMESVPATSGPLPSAERDAIARSIDLELLQRRYGAASGRADLALYHGVIPELAAGVEAEREDDTWEVGPVIELELPIFDQGQAGVDRAEAEMRMLKHEHASTAIAIRAAVRSAGLMLEATNQRSKHLQAVLIPLQEEVLRQTVLQYNAMSIGLFELLAAKRQELAVRQSAIEAQRDYWIARATLNTLLAGRLPRNAVMPSASGGAAPLPQGGGAGH